MPYNHRSLRGLADQSGVCQKLAVIQEALGLALHMLAACFSELNCPAAGAFQPDTDPLVCQLVMV